jgi:LPS-assembly protein
MPPKMMALTRRPVAAALSALSLALIPLPSAAELLEGCPVVPEGFWPELRSLPPDVIEVEADSVDSVRRERIEARGNVQLFANDRRLDSDWIDFYTETRRVETRGRSQLFDGDLLVEAGDSWYQLDSGEGEFSDVQYWLRSRDARGGADQAAQLAPGKIELSEARYTTCPENNESWWLSGSDIRLDQESGRGDARNVTLRFKDVPVFYTPYIQFPIDDRRMSGILMPSAGYSSRNGFDLAVPYYWNIAPDYDATLTPRVLSDRGLMLETEWRYLRPRHDGQVDLNYLPNDSEFGDDRHLFRWQQIARPMKNLRVDVDINDVSDTEYFRDFGADVFSAGTAFVPRRAIAQYDWTNWRLRGQVEDFQTLVPDLEVESEPYQRMPQLVLTGSQSPLPGLDLDLISELVRFDRTNSVTATRFDVYPRAGYRWEKEGYFIEPKAGLRFTGYSLDNVAPDSETSLTRTVPDFSVDGGMFFERWLDRGMIQTLEPRVFYGYVPFRDQDAIPVFDTSERAFRPDTLFTTQRFIGADRVGDTHQITAALSSRFIDPLSGTERLKLTAGQIYYLDDRRVRRVPGEEPLPSGQSELVAGLEAAFGRGWQMESALQYDPDESEISRGDFALSYQPNEKALFNLGYRYERERIDQTDISAIWPLNQRLSAIGRWNYSLEDEQDLDVLAGLEYRSCCYSMRVALRRFLVNSQGDYDNGIYFQITFNGLSRLDTGLEELLRDGIAGYGRFDDVR